MSLWGIDLGGTKIEIVVLRSEAPDDVIFRHRIPTEANFGYQHIVGRIKLLMDQAILETGINPKKLGIATPGTVDPLTGLLKNSNTTCLNGMPLLDALREVLGFPIKIANDANCFALAETKMGIVKDTMPEAKVVFGVIMGTGVGGGIIVNGEPLTGSHGIAGEWGHIFLDQSGGKCYCGKIGCVERVISGTALQKYYQEKSGTFRELKDIVLRAEHENDLIARDTINRLTHFFGLGLSIVINVLDPDVIVLGGGVGNIDLLYTEGVKQAAMHTFNPRLESRFLRPKLGDSAGVFGAALLCAEI